MSPLDEVQALPLSIGGSAMQTFGIYMKAQGARQQEILKVPAKELQYGPTDRQKLDVYYPDNVKDGEKAPVLMFVYGGGLVRGDKRMGRPGFIHGNVGRFFAERGFVTIIPDYRLVGTHEGAVYPSGGEDVSLALEFISQPGNLEPSADLEKVFLMGNSAGALHICTFLFQSSPNIRTLSSLPLKVRGAVLLSAPTDFNECETIRETVNEQYYGTPRGTGRTVRELRATKGGEDETPLLVVTAERDPENEILSCNRRFLALYSESGPLSQVPKPEELLIKRHNHISPPLALGLGGDEDVWGEDVVKWMQGKCSIKGKF
ncbi:alpha/beta-hydrolase [Meredithblackwellia eburnea MCA 4105]